MFVATVPPIGAYCTLSDLIALRLAARDLDLGRQRKVFSLLVGPHQSKFRGRGIEFEEVRAYQAGDDIRSIDWRVTARTGKPHTRLFREERERPVLLLIDQSLSMFFGSQTCCKSVTAAHAGALLAWAAIQHNDRVGGLVFAGADHTQIRPKRSIGNVLQLLNRITAFNQRLNGRLAPEASGIDHALEELRRITRPGSNIFLISDFQGLSEAAFEHLYRLQQHNDVAAIRVYDPLEEELPPPGSYAITDGVQRMTLNTSDSELRRGYREHFREKNAALEKVLNGLTIPLLQLSTQAAPRRFFQDLLGSRK